MKLISVKMENSSLLSLFASVSVTLLVSSLLSLLLLLLLGSGRLGCRGSLLLHLLDRLGLFLGSHDLGEIVLLFGIILLIRRVVRHISNELIILIIRVRVRVRVRVESEWSQRRVRGDSEESQSTRARRARCVRK